MLKSKMEMGKKKNLSELILKHRDHPYFINASHLKMVYQKIQF